MIEKHMWRPVSSTTTAKPSPRWGHSCCVIGDELVLFGGYADSIYMNDVWVYHTTAMQWTEIKTFGTVPTQRSNSSLHFDSINNRVIMFGGGGANKTRYNTLHFLDWNTKIWSQAKLKQHQICPWERTYHSSQLLYPYLIVFGGQGVADLDDLWAFNLQTYTWTELLVDKSNQKPCGRRFHSSCLIGNQFFVIAGCYSKYRPLSDIYSIDLTSFLQTGQTEGLKWKEIQLNGNSFLTRWGHASASLDNKIYIFGGRFSNDLNDVLILDLDLMRMRNLKAASETLPKPRRRACINFVGNCLLMFGGFNSDYFNDLHFINVSEGLTKPKRFSKNYLEVEKIINEKSTSDLSIQTESGQTFYCHKGLLMSTFETDQKLLQFLSKISKKESKENLTEMMKILYKGYGKCEQLSKYGYNNPNTEEEKQSFFFRSIQKIRDRLNPTGNIFSRKNVVKLINNNVIELTDQQFGEFLETNRENTFKDIDIIINNNYVIKSNSTILLTHCNFFKNFLSRKYKQTSQPKTLQIMIPKGNVVLVQIILNFFLTGFLIVPQNMSCQSWIYLYELADYMSINEIKQIALYSIWSKLDEGTVDIIFEYSLAYRINQLSLACSRLKLKYLQQEMDSFQDRHLEMAYNQNKFQIKQKIMTKQANLGLCKKISSTSTVEGEKQNYEAYNQ